MILLSGSGFYVSKNIQIAGNLNIFGDFRTNFLKFRIAEKSRGGLAPRVFHFV
jgi:hypothetical protein